MRLRDLGLLYHDIGLTGLPKSRGEKKTACRWGKDQEYQYAATRPSREVVASLFARFPDSDGVVLLCGESSRGGGSPGLVVLDADDAESAERLIAAHPGAPWVTRTRRGAHVYFRLPSGADPRVIRTHVGAEVEFPGAGFIRVDVKGQGGTITAPWSRYPAKGESPAGTYEPTRWPWAPSDWDRLPVLDPSQRARTSGGRETTVAGLFVPEPAAPQPAAPREPREPLPPRSGRGPMSARERAERYVARAPGAAEGGRERSAFYLACVLVRDFELEDGDAESILLAWNRTCSPPLPEEELLAKVASARKHGKKPFGAKLQAVLERRARAVEQHDCSDARAEEEACRQVEHSDEEPATPVSARASELLELNRATYSLMALENAMTADPLLRKLVRAASRVGSCESVCGCLVCKDGHDHKGHGLRRVRVNRCTETLLCIAAAREEAGAHRKNIADNWPRTCVAEVKVEPTATMEAYMAMRDEVERIRSHASSWRGGGPKVQPRIISGYDSVLVVYLGKYASYAKKAFPEFEWKEMSAKRLGSVVERAWLSVPLAIQRGVDEVGIVRAVIGSPWWLRNRDKRSTAGGDALAELPWTTLARERKAARLRWIEEHGGIDPRECDAVVGHDDRGAEVRCRRLLTETVHHISGEFLAERRGGMCERDKLALALSSGAHERWARAVVSRASTP